MSHIAQVETKILDLDAFAAAVTRCGGEFLLNQTTHAWWGHRAGGGNYVGRPEDDGTCLHAFKVAGTHPVNGSYGPWSVGLIAHPDGVGYKLVYDNYGGAGHALHAAFGQNMSKVIEEYGAEVAIRQLARAGFRTQRTDALQTVR